MTGYVTAHVDEIEEANDGRCPWRPVRHHFGITAFGVSTWTGHDPGDRILNEDDQLSREPGHLRAEEIAEDANEQLYLVHRGRADRRCDQAPPAGAGRLPALPSAPALAGGDRYRLQSDPRRAGIPGADRSDPLELRERRGRRAGSGGVPTRLSGDTLSLVVLSLVFACAALIRRWASPLRRLFIPTAVIGGFLVLGLGPEGMGRLLGGPGLFPENVFAVWRQLPGLLVTVMSASLLLGEHLPPFRKLWSISNPSSDSTTRPVRCWRCRSTAATARWPA